MKKIKYIFLILIAVFTMLSLTSCKTKRIQEECLSDLKKMNNSFELLESEGKLTDYAFDDDGKYGFVVEYIPENNNYITIREYNYSHYKYQLNPTSDVDVEIPVKLVFTPFETNDQKKFERNVTFLIHSKSYYFDYYFEKNEIYGKDKDWHYRAPGGEKEWYYSSKDSYSPNDSHKYTSRVEISLYLEPMKFHFNSKYTSSENWTNKTDTSSLYYYIEEKYIENHGVKLYLDRKNTVEAKESNFSLLLNFVEKLDLTFKEMGLEQYVSPLYEKNDYSFESLFK